MEGNCDQSRKPSFPNPFWGACNEIKERGKRTMKATTAIAHNSTAIILWRISRSVGHTWIPRKLSGILPGRRTVVASDAQSGPSGLSRGISKWGETESLLPGCEVSCRQEFSKKSSRQTVTRVATEGRGWERKSERQSDEERRKKQEYAALPPMFTARKRNRLRMKKTIPGTLLPGTFFQSREFEGEPLKFYQSPPALQFFGSQGYGDL